MTEVCPCGYGSECAIWCGNGHVTGQCEKYPCQICIASIEQAEIWINVLNWRSINDVKALQYAHERLRKLERSWWRRLLPMTSSKRVERD